MTQDTTTRRTDVSLVARHREENDNVRQPGPCIQVRATRRGTSVPGEFIKRTSKLTIVWRIGDCVRVSSEGGFEK